jgi:hypothetical protein
MDGLDGVLLIPPDRGQILGRAVWKARYVVISKPTAPGRDSLSGHGASFSGKPGRTASSASRPPVRAPFDEYVFSIYKNKVCSPFAVHMLSPY